jgi:hypothetical protein
LTYFRTGLVFGFVPKLIANHPLQPLAVSVAHDLKIKDDKKFTNSKPKADCKVHEKVSYTRQWSRVPWPACDPVSLVAQDLLWRLIPRIIQQHKSDQMAGATVYRNTFTFATYKDALVAFGYKDNTGSLDRFVGAADELCRLAFRYKADEEVVVSKPTQQEVKARMKASGASRDTVRSKLTKTQTASVNLCGPVLDDVWEDEKTGQVTLEYSDDFRDMVMNKGWHGGYAKYYLPPSTGLLRSQPGYLLTLKSLAFGNKGFGLKTLDGAYGFLGIDSKDNYNKRKALKRATAVMNTYRQHANNVHGLGNQDSLRQVRLVEKQGMASWS